jgi:hypothetical protein
MDDIVANTTSMQTADTILRRWLRTAASMKDAQGNFMQQSLKMMSEAMSDASDALRGVLNKLGEMANEIRFMPLTRLMRTRRNEEGRQFGRVVAMNAGRDDATTQTIWTHDNKIKPRRAAPTPAQENEV